MKPRISLDQLRGNSQRITCFAHTSFEQVVNLQLFTDIGDIEVFAFELE